MTALKAIPQEKSAAQGEYFKGDSSQ